ncbi:hypothetical protein [Brevibacterium litoralis]|uniref:hypothetical protein n=1 Tax=Brevibacterium litoralis TaxID=3138935 RepID=UPI0032EC225C
MDGTDFDELLYRGPTARVESMVTTLTEPNDAFTSSRGEPGEAARSTILSLYSGASDSIKQWIHSLIRAEPADPDLRHDVMFHIDGISTAGHMWFTDEAFGGEVRLDRYSIGVGGHGRFDPWALNLRTMTGNDLDLFAFPSMPARDGTRIINRFGERTLDSSS